MLWRVQVRTYHHRRYDFILWISYLCGMSELRKNILSETRRVVIKFGSKVLVDTDKSDIRTRHISRLVASIAQIHAKGIQVVIVTSGAVGAGMSLLGYDAKPKLLEEKQACAAVGQIKLMHTYKNAFIKHHIHCAQILLSADDFRDRVRYRNIRNTVNALLQRGVIPIINENDSVATSEIKVGDNDKLSADVSHFLDADLLMLFSDEKGLYDSNPKTNPKAGFLHLVPEVTEDILKLGGKEGQTGSAISTGGMHSKLCAIKEATMAGCNVVLCSGFDTLPAKILDGNHLDGTLFLAQRTRLSSRKKWLRFVSTPKGTLIVDAGGVTALQQKNSSLLAVGVQKVLGKFKKGDLVEIQDTHNHRIARGIVNFTKEDIDKVKGLQSSALQERIGPVSSEEIVHRNNMVLL
jgi:glutamate 5-kinase